MRHLTLIPLLLVVACGSVRELRITMAHERGCMTHEQINATDWPESVKARARARQVIPGMTPDQVEGSWGQPSERIDVNGVSVWIYDEVDNSVVDGAHIAQQFVRFDDDGLVLAVSSAG